LAEAIETVANNSRGNAMKAFRAVLIGTDGRVQALDCDGLESMQRAVGGYIELLFLTKKVGGFVNEGGGYGLPPNPVAGRVCERLGVKLTQPAFGPLLLVGPPSRHGNETDCPDDVRAVAFEAGESLDDPAGAGPGCHAERDRTPESTAHGSATATSATGGYGPETEAADRRSFREAVAVREWVRAGDLRIEAGLISLIASKGPTRDDTVAALCGIWRYTTGPLLAGFSLGQLEFFPSCWPLAGWSTTSASSTESGTSPHNPTFLTASEGRRRMPQPSAPRSRSMHPVVARRNMHGSISVPLADYPDLFWVRRERLQPTCRAVGVEYAEGLTGWAWMGCRAEALSEDA
jgi:hypothetical protein